MAYWLFLAIIFINPYQASTQSAIFSPQTTSNMTHDVLFLFLDVSNVEEK